MEQRLDFLVLLTYSLKEGKVDKAKAKVCLSVTVRLGYGESVDGHFLPRAK